MFKSDVAKIALIENFNDNLFARYAYAIRCFLKYVFYSFFIPSKVYEEKYKLRYLPQYKIVGHRALALSLIRGLKENQIKFTFNKITEYTEYIVLLWADEKDLNYLHKLKIKQKIKKVLTAPTACKYDYGMVYKFAECEDVDYVLCGSDEIKKGIVSNISKKISHKIQTWPSGVEVFSYIDKRPYEKCVIYLKRSRLDDQILFLLNKHNIKYEIFEYGKYTYLDYIKALSMSDFSIFVNGIGETQGLAYAEAWERNVPTFIYLDKNHTKKQMAPYLCKENGSFFHSYSELEDLITGYSKDKIVFLGNFNARNYIINNMSDKVSVEKMLKFLY